MDYISQFTTDLRYVRGIDNSFADALSQIEANVLTQSLPPVVDFQVMAEAQRTDPELQGQMSTEMSITGLNPVFIVNVLKLPDIPKPP